MRQAAVLAVVLVGCGGDSAPPSVQPATPEQEKVALFIVEEYAREGGRMKDVVFKKWSQEKDGGRVAVAVEYKLGNLEQYKVFSVYEDGKVLPPLEP